MPEVTPEDVQCVWESRVRVLLGAPDYVTRGKKWQGVFKRVAERVTTLNISLRAFVDAQIEWAIHLNKPGVIWPNIMEGDKALARYNALPSESQSLNDLREYYLSQAAAFSRVCETLSEDVALNNQVIEHSPLFLCYVTWKSGRRPSAELVESACLELEVRAQAREIFDILFVGFLEGR